MPQSAELNESEVGLSLSAAVLIAAGSAIRAKLQGGNWNGRKALSMIVAKISL